MAWCRPGDKPLSEPMMVRLPTHICVARPQLVRKTPVIKIKKMVQPESINKDMDLISLINNTLMPEPNGCRFILECNFLGENCCVLIKISNFASSNLVNNKLSLVEIMFWSQTVDMPLPKAMTIYLLKQTCLTQLQWVNICFTCYWLPDESRSHMSKSCQIQKIKIHWFVLCEFLTKPEQ